MKTKFWLGAVVAAGMSLCGTMQAQGQAKLIAKGRAGMDGTTSAANAVSKTLFLDVVKELTAKRNHRGSDSGQAGRDHAGTRRGQQWDDAAHAVGSKRQRVPAGPERTGDESEPVFCVWVCDADLAGSVLVLQQPQGSAKKD